MVYRIRLLPQNLRTPYSNTPSRWSFPYTSQYSIRCASSLQSSPIRKLQAYNVHHPPELSDCAIPGLLQWCWEPERDGDFFCSDAEAEPLIHYREGGYHPVHVRDKLQDGRYEIMQKLGWGHDGTVWLARDKTYVSWRTRIVQKLKC